MIKRKIEITATERIRIVIPPVKADPGAAPDDATASEAVQPGPTSVFDIESVKPSQHAPQDAEDHPGG